MNHEKSGSTNLKKLEELTYELVGEETMKKCEEKWNKIPEDERMGYLWQLTYELAVEEGATDLSFSEYRQSFSGSTMEDLKRTTKELEDMTIELVGDIHVQGMEYEPGSSATYSFAGNPFSPMSHLKYSGAKKLREDLLDPKNM